MNRPRLIRGLKITWTVFCGIACLLLIVLWVRSYWRVDTVRLNATANRVLQVSVAPGRLLVVSADRSPGWLPDHVSADDFRDMVLSQHFATESLRPLSYDECLEMKFPGNHTFPFWTIVFATSILAITPWLPWWSHRFSLRTLLIATTLLCVVLGLAVWAVR
jgi:hypothetical protein